MKSSKSFVSKTVRGVGGGGEGEGWGEGGIVSYLKGEKEIKKPAVIRILSLLSLFCSQVLRFLI